MKTQLIVAPNRKEASRIAKAHFGCPVIYKGIFHKGRYGNNFYQFQPTSKTSNN